MFPSYEPGFAIWFTGLPSSGKTVISQRVCEILAHMGKTIVLYDSDDLRAFLTPAPVYTDEERDWFYGVIVHLAGHLAESGVNVAVSATAQRRHYRANARLRIERFIEVYLDCPEEICRARDPKGLWKRSDSGEIKSLPGAGAPYEAPLLSEVRIDAGSVPIDGAAYQVLDKLEELGFIEKGCDRGNDDRSKGKTVSL